MLALYLSPALASSIDLEKTSEGEYGLRSYESLPLPSDTFSNGELHHPKETSNLVVNLLNSTESLILIACESTYYTCRTSLSASKGDMENEILRALNLPPQKLYTTSINLTSKDSEHVSLHFSIPEPIARSYRSFANHLPSQILKLIPESYAAFPVIKKAIGKQEVVAYVPEATSIIFYDQHGPIWSQAQEGKDLAIEASKSISDFYKSHHHKVKKIITTNSLAPQLKKVDEDVIPLQFILEHTLSEMTPAGLEGVQIDTLNPALLGVHLIEGSNSPDFAPTLLHEPQLPLVEILKESIAPASDGSSAEPTTSPFSRRKFMGYLLTSFTLGVVVALGAIKLTNPDIRISIQPTPTPTHTPTPSPTPRPIDRKSLKIRVLNGTTTPKLAKGFSDLLIAKGYSIPEIGNAETKTYTSSRISLKPDKSAALNLIVLDTKSTINLLPDPAPLPDTSEFDLVIILGNDYIASTTTPIPTP